MIELELQRPLHHTDRVDWVSVLHIEVEAQDHCTISGDLRYLDLSMPLLNRRTGEPVSAHEDLEEWVRNLAESYSRAGDLAVVVLQDSNPLSEPDATEYPEEQRVEVHDHSEVAAH